MNENWMAPLLNIDFEGKLPKKGVDWKIFEKQIRRKDISPRMKLLTCEKVSVRNHLENELWLSRKHSSCNVEKLTFWVKTVYLVSFGTEEATWRPVFSAENYDFCLCCHIEVPNWRDDELALDVFDQTIGDLEMIVQRGAHAKFRNWSCKKRWRHSRISSCETEIKICLQNWHKNKVSAWAEDSGQMISKAWTFDARMHSERPLLCWKLWNMLFEKTLNQDSTENFWKFKLQRKIFSASRRPCMAEKFLSKTFIS